MKKIKEDDSIIQYYNARTLLVPTFLRSAKNAQSKGYDIQVELNGKVIDVPHTYKIEQFIKDNNIELELEE